MDTVRFDAPGPDGKPSQALYCLNSPVNLISSGAMKQDGVEHDSTNDKLVVKEVNRELARVYWNNNVAIVPSYPPTSLDIECNIDKTTIAVRGQKEPIQELRRDADSKSQKKKEVPKANRLLTSELTPEPNERTEQTDNYPMKPPDASDDLSDIEDFNAKEVADLRREAPIPPDNPIAEYITSSPAMRQSRGLQGVDDEMPDKENESERRTSQRKRALRFGQEGKKGLYKKPNNWQLDGQTAKDPGVETAQSTVWLTQKPTVLVHDYSASDEGPWLR